MKKPFSFYKLSLFDLLYIIVILYVAYEIYKYGVWSYIKKRREKKAWALWKKNQDWKEAPIVVDVEGYLKQKNKK